MHNTISKNTLFVFIETTKGRILFEKKNHYLFRKLICKTETNSSIASFKKKVKTTERFSVMQIFSWIVAWKSLKENSTKNLFFYCKNDVEFALFWKLPSRVWKWLIQNNFHTVFCLRYNIGMWKARGKLSNRLNKFIHSFYCELIRFVWKAPITCLFPKVTDEILMDESDWLRERPSFALDGTLERLIVSHSKMFGGGALNFLLGDRLKM